MELIDCWRYPVKSMQGFRRRQPCCDADRVRGDRRWALIDTTTGKLASAMRFSALLDAAATDYAEVTPTTSATYQ